MGATAVALALQTACSAPDRTPPPTAPAAPAAPATTPAPPPTAATAATPAVVVPADAVYACVVDHAGAREQTTMAFDPKVGDLCRRHPEMGPCQYERNQCRARGGRVYATGGVEITLATEAEYDKQVMRTRFRAN